MATLADTTRDGSPDIHYHIIYRYPDDAPLGEGSHELRKYADHSFAEYINHKKIRVLTWRELASIKKELERGEAYDIVCQDNADPRAPEIREYIYSPNGNRQTERQFWRFTLWQIPYNKHYFYEKEAVGTRHTLDENDVARYKTQYEEKNKKWEHYAEVMGSEDDKDDWNSKYKRKHNEVEVKMLLAELEMLQ